MYLWSPSGAGSTPEEAPLPCSRTVVRFTFSYARVDKTYST